MEQHESRAPDGSRRFRGTTLRTQFSMIKKWFTLVPKQDVEKLMPQFDDRLREYEQDQPAVTKALTFTTGAP